MEAIMAASVDFAEVKQQVSVHQVMTMLNLTLKQSGGQFRGSCPVHGGNDRTFVITPAKGFYCFNEKKGGDAIALCAHVRQIPMREAALAIAEHFGVGDTPARRPAASTTPTKPPGGRAFDAEAYAKRLDPNHDALAALGIAPETFQAFGSGYAAGGVNRGRLALPIHDREGKCVAYIGRALGDESPTMVFPNGFAAQEHIFNAHKVSEGELYLVRDPLDVLRAFEGGIENVVSFLGPMTPHNLEILAALCDERKVETIEIY
jgi:DNA primase